MENTESKKWYTQTWAKLTALVGFLAVLIPLVKESLSVYQSTQNDGCFKISKIHGKWSQEYLNEADMYSEDKSEYHVRNLTLHLNKDNTYSYLMERTTYYLNNKEFDSWQKEYHKGSGEWKFDCKYILYKNLGDTLYDIKLSPGLRAFLERSTDKAQKEYLAMIDTTTIFEISNPQKRETNWEEIEHQEILEMQSNLFKTNKLIYKRIK